MTLFCIALAVMAASAVIINLRRQEMGRQEKIAGDIAQEAGELGYLSQDYVIYGESQQLDRWHTLYTAFSAKVSRLHANRPEHRVLVYNIREDQKRLKEVFDSIVSPVGNQFQSPARETVLELNRLEISWSRMTIQIQGLVSNALRLSQSLHQEMDRLTNTNAWITYGLILLLSAFLLSIYLFTYRRILKSIAELQTGAAVIGSGNLEYRIKEERQDEIGDLSRAFNRMSADLKAVTASKVELEKEIADRLHAEDVARESTATLEAAMASMTDAVFISDTNGHFIHLNAAFATFHRFDSRDQCARTLNEYPDFLEVFLDDGTLAPLDMWAVPRALRGESATNAEYMLRRKDTGQTWIGSYSFGPIRDRKGKIVGSVVVGRDITERKQAAAALNEKMLEYVMMFERSVVGKAQADPKTGRFLKVNQAFSDMTGFSPDELCRMTFVDITHPDDRKHDVRGFEPVRAGDTDSWQIEKRCLKKDGSVIWVNVSGNYLRFEDNRPDRTIAVIQDITDRKKMEEDLKSSLTEKEVLLKEIHHRVKNNMQVISSLVDLQANEIQDPAMRDIFKDVIYRIRSMAMVHEKLYQSTDLARVDFADYARSLLGYLWRVQEGANKGIQLDLNLEPVVLPVNSAVPCGLILNELFSNALKHAFKGRDSGKVSVSLQRKGDSRLHLEVKDNGIGMPRELNWQKAHSLGLRLVQMLAQQLHAAVKAESEKGTKFMIIFEVPKS